MRKCMTTHALSHTTMWIKLNQSKCTVKQWKINQSVVCWLCMVLMILGRLKYIQPSPVPLRLGLLLKGWTDVNHQVLITNHQNWFKPESINLLIISVIRNNYLNSGRSHLYLVITRVTDRTVLIVEFLSFINWIHNFIQCSSLQVNSICMKLLANISGDTDIRYSYMWMGLVTVIWTNHTHAHACSCTCMLSLENQ